MKSIPVAGGYFALVDDEDYEEMSKLRWHTAKGRKTIYASTNVKRETGGYSSVGMHRMINKTPAGFHTDHIDGDGLNNQRSNLRTASRTENARNRSPNTGCASQFKGVHWNKRKRRWVASIRVNKKSVFLGLHKSEQAAADAYSRAASQYFGEFARTQSGVIL
jgi:hypothetical protein